MPKGGSITPVLPPFGVSQSVRRARRAPPWSLRAAP
ncbi:hypothetical protein FHS38_005597 [Streptomyces netropsis]|uniref:Uncharacterized protein n=1 Tax=Streptomyces netropsis TaxID=55404 RepID=A0A7W7LGI7_STRNE|nr:hypothetical protein [Streptomyces netropsis]